MWQMPEYFISTRTSLPLTSSSTMGVSLKSSPGLWTTNASVSILVKDILNHSAKLKGVVFFDVSSDGLGCFRAAHILIVGLETGRRQATQYLPSPLPHDG